MIFNIFNFQFTFIFLNDNEKKELNYLHVLQFT